MKKHKCLYFFSFMSMIKSTRENEFNPIPRPGALLIYIQEETKNFPKLAEKLTDFKDLDNLRESFKDLIIKLKETKHFLGTCIKSSK